MAEIRDKKTQRFITMHAKMAKHGDHHWWIGAQILPDYQKVTYCTINSMTQLLTHSVAHPTKPSSRPKTNNQSIKKFLSLAVSCVKVVKNWLSF